MTSNTKEDQTFTGSRSTPYGMTGKDLLDCATEVGQGSHGSATSEVNGSGSGAGSGSSMSPPPESPPFTALRPRGPGRTGPGRTNYKSASVEDDLDDPTSTIPGKSQGVQTAASRPPPTPSSTQTAAPNGSGQTAQEQFASWLHSPKDRQKGGAQSGTGSRFGGSRAG